ncbi:MAG: hypothetical protein ABEH78_01430 [Haloferacaceae archaeon]
MFELPDRSAYYVLHDDYVCVYRPPAAGRSRTAPPDGDGEAASDVPTGRDDGAHPDAPADDAWTDSDVDAPDEAGDADDRSP